MPRAYRKTTSKLSIELAAPQGWSFAAGDTIIGNVLRKDHVVTSHGRVTIKLMGRAKVKIETGSGSSDQYRSRFNFFDAPGCQTGIVLYEGPVHIPEEEGSQAWPFAIPIPLGPGLKSRDPDPQNPSYLPLTPEDVVRHALPGSFYSGGHEFGSTSEGFVEYFLEAELRYLRREMTEAAESTLPIVIRPPSSLQPLTDFKMQEESFNKAVKSYRFTPGMESSGLSFKQKSKQLFGSGSVPEFVFNMRFSAPTMLQLNSADTFPLLVQVTALSAGTSPSIRGLPQKVVIKSITLTIGSYTTVMAPRHFSSMPLESHQKTTHNVGLERAFELIKEPFVLTASDDGEFMDFGRALQLRLAPEGLTSFNQRMAPTDRIQPGFTTYNMMHTHEFRYVIRVSIGDKDEKFEAGVKTCVVPPPGPAPAHMSLPGPQPGPAQQPMSEQAPPAFEDVVAEGSRTATNGDSKTTPKQDATDKPSDT